MRLPLDSSSTVPTCLNRKSRYTSAPPSMYSHNCCETYFLGFSVHFQPEISLSLGSREYMSAAYAPVMKAKKTYASSAKRFVRCVNDVEQPYGVNAMKLILCRCF